MLSLPLSRFEDICRLSVVGPVRPQAHDMALLGRSVVGNRGETTLLVGSVVGPQASETTLLVGSVVDNRGEAAFLNGNIVRSQASEPTLLELECLTRGLASKQVATL